MNESFARIDHRIRAGAILLALCLPAHTALALLGVPYGKDGVQDSDTQAKTQAYNDDLRGPKDGQSEQSWELKLKMDHDALFGSAQTYSSSTTSSTSSDADAGGPPANPPIDMCQGTLDDWLNPSPKTPMTEALGDPAIVGEVETQLENFIYYMVLVQTASTGKTTVGVDRPTVSGLQCTADGSKLKATIPVSVKELGVTLDHGTVVVHGSASYRPAISDDGGEDGASDWCFDVGSYDISGFEPLTSAMIRPRLNDALSIKRFCSTPYTPPPWGTPTK
jgi:hypothetical protein